MEFKEYALSRQTEICLELERVKLLLRKAGNPDRKLKIIHVAGTNGKGSVCSFVCEGLLHASKKFGRFSSPELFCVNDTVSIDGKNISDTELGRLLSFLSPLCDEVEAETGKKPSQFEICFVAAMLWYAEQNCEYAVLECGMGGIGDATNSIEDSCISVICHIALDHTQFLGNTLAEIAKNKCGIFKKSSVVISGTQDETVMEIIRRETQNRQLIMAEFPQSSGRDGFCEIFDYNGMHNLKSSLCGTHQPYNASIAIEVLKALNIGEESIRYAVSHARNPARMEQIGKNIFFDGAHNPDGVKALVKSINRYNPDGKVAFVVGFMKDKAYRDALLCLNDLKKPEFELYTVNVYSNQRSEQSDVLCKTAENLGFSSHCCDDVESAIFEAAEKADWVFVFGSLYMYKELPFERIKNEN